MSRFLRPALLLSILTVLPAATSSILVLEGREGALSPSISAVSTGTGQSALPSPEGTTPASGSVITLGEPAVANEFTSAVKDRTEPASIQLELRGSLSDDVSAEGPRNAQRPPSQ